MRELHENGAGAADIYLASASAADLAHSKQGVVTMTQNAIDAFDTYKQLNASDGRTERDVNVNQPLLFGSDLLKVRIPVVLDDGNGRVVPRIVLWDLAGCSATQAEILASPALTTCDAIYGAGATSEIQVWDLRSGQTHTVSPTQASAQATAAATAVANAAS